MNKTKNATLGIIIALSIAMVGATVAIAIPNQVEAAGTGWCNAKDCFKGKGQCEKAPDEDGACVKIPGGPKPGP